MLGLCCKPGAASTQEDKNLSFEEKKQQNITHCSAPYERIDRP
jgi:hypothetical protein